MLVEISLVENWYNNFNIGIFNKVWTTARDKSNRFSKNDATRR